MLGIYDFCGHYEWTFEWLRQEGGDALVRDYWEEAISVDSQRHARELILRLGFEGMARYWTPTLEEEGGDSVIIAREDVFRIDMHACPSKGFLLSNGLEQYKDYCDHCMGWIYPLMKEAGFRIDHQHNHRGQCWWEFRRAEDGAPYSAPGEVAEKQDIRFYPSWRKEDLRDSFWHESNPDKVSSQESKKS